ncbi:competence protein CoiA family protein [Streptomyces sp. NPDC046275]|uniref:competence protein CoiA family protein n=1 Tax=Streptomyces sp. NPDC046275 TaxID=3157201 RepID=UPI0033FAF154
MTPFADEEDTRKVQTAVIGRAGSDDPVFLPYDHDEFDLFMRGRSRDDFYCGTLLGGCGKKLSAKRYTEKKCHFAHRPPVHCQRTANGESSADHLYIGQALTRWLARQNHRQAKASYRTVGDRPGGIVDFRLSGGRQLIRVQMARLGLHPWRQEAEALARGADNVEWLFGPDSMLAFDRVESHGYAIRVECRTVGVTREVRIGTQLPGNTIEWTTLEECSLTPQGIVTPGLVSTPQGIVPRGSAAAAATPVPRLSFVLADDTVAFTGAVPRPDVQSPTRAPGSVYDADIQPLGSAVTRARIVLPHASTPPNPSKVYLLRERVTLTPVEGATADVPAWLVTAAQTRRLGAREAAAWNGLKPPQPVPAAAAPLPVEQPPAPPRPRLDDREIVASFRETLERTARAHGRITWSKLVGSARATPQQFTSEHQRRLLIALDFPRAEEKPVLSSLLRTENGEVPSFFAAVLTGLGWAPGLPGNQVRHINERERERAYELLGESPGVASPPPSVAPVLPRPRPVRQAPPPRNRKLEAVEPASPHALSTRQLVLAVREHLRERARNGAEVTWRELSANTGIGFDAFPDERLADLLFRVDDPLKGQSLMYAALIVTDDGEPLPYFPQLLQRHERPVPGLRSEAHQARRLEVDRIRDAYATGGSGSVGVPTTAPAAATIPAPGHEPPAASAPDPVGRPVDTSVAAALGTLAGLRWRFDHARRAGDLAEAKRAWQAAGKLYGTKLPPAEQAEYRPHLRDMSEWVRERENDIVQADLRRLLDDLRRRQGPAEADALRDGLARAKELKRQHHGKLPQDLQDAHRACGERLAELLAVPSGSDASSVAPKTEHVPRPDAAKLSELAGVVRSLLEDTARNRATLTWSAIRHRVSVEVPHLHPDDQGQLLVLADANTPADEPLLSALVTTNNGDLHPLYRHVAFSLGREVPSRQDELHARWQMDVLRLYSLWKHR